MRMNPNRNKETYNLTMHPVDAPTSANHIRGVLKNQSKREPSPFQEGARNKDWVNPTLASNVLFYNHGLEEASNHHIQAKKVNKKGYNLNHYVVYDAEPKGTQPSTTPHRDKADKVSVDGRQRDGRSTSQNQSEAARQSAYERPVSPITSEKRVPIDRSRSPVDGRSNSRVHGRSTTPQSPNNPVTSTDQRPNRQPSPIQQEQRSSSHIERAYDRSQRSGSVNSPQIGGGINKSASQQNIRSTTPSGQDLPPTSQPLQEQRIGLSRSNSAVSVQRYGDFLKATASNISNPENLVCDYCVNDEMHNAKVDKANALRRQDIEHANRIDEELKRQVEDERRRNHEKLATYKDQIDAQKYDLEDRKRREKVQAADEQHKIQNMIEENNYVDWKRIQNEHDKKKRFMDELVDQMGRTQESRQQRLQREADEDRGNPNLLINDADRQALNRAKADRYKDIIKTQLEDQVRDKSGKKDQEKAENDAYRKKVQEMISKDIDARRNIAQAKREAFVNGVDQHLALRDDIRAKERKVKGIELDNLAQKLAHDRQLESERIHAKKHQMADYIKSLGNQIADKEAEKKVKSAQEKQLMNGTLLIPQKHDKCYNCAKCRNNYPLKLLNKTKRQAKA